MCSLYERSLYEPLMPFLFPGLQHLDIGMLTLEPFTEWNKYILKFLPGVKNISPKNFLDSIVTPLSASHGHQGSESAAKGQTLSGNHSSTALCSTSSSTETEITDFSCSPMVFYDANMHVHILLFMLHSYSTLVPHYNVLDMDFSMG
jgi:hypothetical protein